MANLSNINNKFIVESDGDVGIGVTTALDKLNVGDGNIRISQVGNVASQLILNTYQSALGNTTYKWFVGQTTSANSYSFQIGNGTTPYLHINSLLFGAAAGNVGIGTSSPLNKLFVSANTAGDYAAFIENTNSTNGYGLVARTAHTGTQAYAFAARAGASDIFVVRGDGNVGIGTNSPTNGKLEVQQTATTAGLWVQTGGTTSSYTIADFRTGTNLSALAIKGDGNSTFAGSVTAGGTLTVNGTGNSAFGGQVFINGLSNYTGLTLTGSGGSRPAINFNNVNNGVLGSIFGTEGNAIIISTNGGNAVTIDSSQNSTFAGDGDFGGQIFVGTQNSTFAENNLKFESAGDSFIDHATIGKNINFRVSNGGSVNLTAMSLFSTGNANFDQSIIVGGGIYLGGTAAANLLDDYEEGTWTPAVSAPFSPSGVTYNFRGGSFVRIGGKVWVRMGLNVANVGTGGSGNLFVTGLPFTAANVGAYQEPTAGANGGRWVTASNAGNVYAFVQNSTSQFVFRTMASNADTVLNYSEIQGGAAGGGTWFTLQCFYDIA